VLLAGSRVLLCRNLKHDYLYLPGGHIEFGESAPGALVREFLEESGLTVRVGDLALVSENAFATRKRRHHEVNLVFHVEHAGPRPLKPETVASREPDLGLEWTDLAAIPELDLRPPSAKAFLAALGHQPPGTIEWISEITPDRP
jgi:ADP-ribose pyrophosphatase YjhB (NUDIX family)